LDETGKPIKEERGFTARSLNLLLKKIVEHESREEALEKGIISHDQLYNNPPEALDQMIPIKPVEPLVKNMYVRDLARKAIFLIEKFKH